MDCDSDRIIVERLHGHWSAWFDSEPQIAFGGVTPAEVMDSWWASQHRHPTAAKSAELMSY